ncbi:hypothetical protein SK128_018799 [Halocaridina rubra]|uniref:Uncharacterized protein n=1 Tax=Halocaridina rubra TaxID=373956 RepID=A0AAN8WY10_HALRR
MSSTSSLDHFIAVIKSSLEHSIVANKPLPLDSFIVIPDKEKVLVRRRPSVNKKEVATDTRNIFRFRSSRTLKDTNFYGDFKAKMLSAGAASKPLAHGHFIVTSLVAYNACELGRAGGRWALVGRTASGPGQLSRSYSELQD